MIVSFIRHYVNTLSSNNTWIYLCNVIKRGRRLNESLAFSVNTVNQFTEKRIFCWLILALSLRIVITLEVRKPLTASHLCSCHAQSYSCFYNMAWSNVIVHPNFHACNICTVPFKTNTKTFNLCLETEPPLHYLTTRWRDSINLDLMAVKVLPGFWWTNRGRWNILLNFLEREKNNRTSGMKINHITEKISRGMTAFVIHPWPLCDWEWRWMKASVAKRAMLHGVSPDNCLFLFIDKTLCKFSSCMKSRFSCISVFVLRLEDAEGGCVSTKARSPLESVVEQNWHRLQHKPRLKTVVLFLTGWATTQIWRVLLVLFFFSNSWIKLMQFTVLPTDLIKIVESYIIF